jgi:hypothetical protein
MDKKARDKFISPYKTFDDFINDHSCNDRIYTDLINQQHFKPQYTFIDNIESSNSPNKFKYLTSNISFIGRFENLYEDFDLVCKKIGIETLKLNHKNGRAHKPYQTYYTDKTAEIIYNTYKEDIDCFNYSFNS